MANKLGIYIKERRSALGVSLREFGKLCDISHTHVDSIEKGFDFRTNKPVNITNDTFQKLATALNVDEGYLLALSLNKETSEHISQKWDDDVLEAMQAMRDRPELQTMFSTSRHVKKEHIEAVNEMLKKFAGMDEDF